MSKDTVIKIISYWLPDIIDSLITSLERECLLIIKKNKGRNTGFTDTLSLNFSRKYLDKIKNFKWIKINKNTYTFCHFKKYFNILETYAFAFSNITQITFHPNLDYNIFSIYVLIYCLCNNISIINYSENIKNTYIVCDDKNIDTNILDQVIYIGENSINYNIFLEIQHDNYQVKNIKRKQNNIYNYLNFNYNYYTLCFNKKNDCDMFDKFRRKNNEYISEDLIRLPLCILFRFIKSCYFLLKQYPFLVSDCNQVDNKQISDKILELIWCDTAIDNSKHPNKNKIFNITIVANTSNNYFYTKINYSSLLLKYAPYSILIKNNFDQLTNSIDSLYIRPLIHKYEENLYYYNYNLYETLLILIIIFSLMLKHIITFKNNNLYDYIKLDLPICDIDDLLLKISLIYSKQNLYYPFIIRWNPNPTLLLNIKSNNTINTYCILILEQIISKYIKYNFITSNIINIRILPSLNEWSNSIKVNNLNEIYNNKQYLLITKKKNNIHLEGKCNLLVRKILYSIKESS